MSAASAHSSVQVNVGPRPFIENSRSFVEVSGKLNPEKMSVVSEIFRRILTPLYGSQDKAIRQIEESKDRRCFLLFEEEAAVGVLVFKTVLSNEFKGLGVEDSIEVKSLFVDNSGVNSGRGVGSDLVSKLKEEAEKLGLNHKGIHVTVSETKNDSLMFFQKKNFKIVYEWKGRYVAGTKEYLLSCPRNIAANSVPPAPATLEGRSLLLVIPKAHLGDITLLKRLTDATFISGSKDNCVYKWDETGKLVQIIDEVEPQYQTETDWITAAAVINRSHFVTGKRNGVISLWRSEGGFVKNIPVNFQRKRIQHISHEHNQRRVTCLAEGIDPCNPSFFVGFPTEFEEYNLIEGQTIASTVVHSNDWPWCIHPYSADSLFTVVGANVEAWKKKEGQWNYSATLLKQTKVKGEQRAFITSLKELDRPSNAFILSDMKGAIKQLDIQQSAIVSEWKEHTNIIWSTEPLNPTTFASCSEDATIKIWDVRQKGSARTVTDIGRSVNALLKLKENLLLAGTGSAADSKEADIRFYDYRK